MSQPREKRENDTKNRFIEYLKTTEGTEYQTIGESVKTRSGIKDFDYLLQNPSGYLLALEITCFTEPEELKADAMRQEIMQALSPLLPTEGFSGFFIAEISYYPYLFSSSKGALVSTLRNKAAHISNQIIAAAQTLSGNESASVMSEVGPIFVRRLGDGEGIFLSSSTHRVSNYESSWEHFSKEVAELIPRKNQQLDYDAKRKVLLICNTCYMSLDALVSGAITDFTQRSPSNLSNIDEIYVEFKVNKFGRIYPAAKD